MRIKVILASFAFTAMIALSITGKAYAACGGALQPSCPSLPTLSGSAGPETAILTWTQSTNVTTTYYNLRQGTTTVIYSGGMTQFTQTNLTAGTTYGFYVQACNPDGCSSYTAVKNVTPTTITPPTTPPTDWLTGTQTEALLVKFSALWIALIIGGYAVSEFRYRT